MPKAKTLQEYEIPILFQDRREHSRRPERDLCLHGLSYFCALRAQEIARLEKRDVTDAAGRIADKLEVTPHAAKYGKPRTLPMPQNVKDALSAYLRKYPIKNGPLFFNQFGQRMTSGAVQKQLARIGRAAGFDVSSHSGRRTCLTFAARKVHMINGSLRDVQLLAGHADLATTQSYLEPTSRHAELLERLYSPTGANAERGLAKIPPFSIVSPDDTGAGASSYFRRRSRFRKRKARN